MHLKLRIRTEYFNFNYVSYFNYVYNASFNSICNFICFYDNTLLMGKVIFSRSVDLILIKKRLDKFKTYFYLQF